MANPLRHTPEFLRGREGEQRIAEFLKQRGWYIIPSYDYSGPDGDKAPKIQGAHEGIVLPDLGIARSGRLKWAEVKTKHAPTFTIQTHTTDHGIGYRNWLHYRRCQQETGAHVWLFILEECSQEILFQSLDVLGRGRVYTGDRMDRGGMMFWQRDAFMKCVLDALPGLFDEAGPLGFEID